MTTATAKKTTKAADKDLLTDTKIQPKVFLIGMMGSGKSYWAEKLKKKLKVPAYDLDALIEMMEEKSVKEIFEEDGEDYFIDRILRRLRVYNGVFRSLVQRQFLRAVRLLESRLWSLLVVLVVWHAFLQLPFAATFLVQVVPPECLCRLFRRHVRERGHVV